MALGMDVGLGPVHIVLDGDTALLPKKGEEPPFLAHVNCGRMARWTKTPLGTEVDHIVPHSILDGFPAPTKGSQQPPLFGPCLL